MTRPPEHRPPSSRWLRLVVAATAASTTALLGLTPPVVAAPVLQQPPVPGAPSDDGLGKADRERLAEAEAAGAQEVTLLVAAEPDRSAAAVSDLEALGGVVQSVEADVDYLKVSVPIAAVGRAAKLDSVSAVDVDGLIALDDPRPDGTVAPLPQPAPGAGTPRVNPYLPTGDTGAAQFAASNRRFDGRGTTVAILDSGVDLDHPALATTTTGDRKVVDWYTANSPTSGDGTWVRMSDTATTGSFEAAGRTWVAPVAGGPYSSGVFAETARDLGQPGSDTGGDINRDGDRDDSFGVLQDVITKEVFVDTDGNGDFTDNARLIDYKARADIGYFGVDDPATAVAERVAFVVQTDRSDYGAGSTPWVSLGIAGNAHGSHVAGIAAGNDLFGGAMDGAAPGAGVMSVKACLATNSCTSSGLIDGVLYAARNGADVVNISIGGLPALNDGNNARAALYDRTIAEYDVQLFISAGNSGPGANTVGDPSVATDALSVGSSITDDTWLSNYGAEAPAQDGLHPFSSRGPREDGGFKPQIVAPGAAISTIPRWQGGEAVPGTYELPPGYGMFNGTSMAAPQATGAAALLVGAYKSAHRGKRPDVAALRSAITSSTRFLPGVGAYEQGAGQVDVAAAWQLLQASPAPDTIVTSVPVSTALSDLLATPGVGVGIHDREGVQADYTRDYTLTRTTGAPGNRLFALSWLGNDGTFTSRARVRLPLDQPVTVPVRIRPQGPGAHSAVLRIDSADTAGIDAQTMNAVFAPAATDAAFVATASGTVGRVQSRNTFVTVPEGTTALAVELEGGGEAAGAGQLRFLRYDPYGVPLDSTASTNCYTPPAPGGGCAGGTPTSRTVVDPTPGTWEIVVESRRTSDAVQSPFTVRATLLGAVIEPDPDVIASAAAGTPVERTWTVRNELGPFIGRLVGGALGSARVERPVIADAEQQAFDVTVPAGATSFTATIGNPSDAGADLDLLVFDCTSGTCGAEPVAVDADGDSEESVTLPDPAPGAWRVVVDGYEVPAGTTEYDYLDVAVAPTFGAIDVVDADAERPSGTSWTATGTVTAGEQPGEGRVLRGEVAVVTSAGVTIATAAVIVREVTAAGPAATATTAPSTTGSVPVPDPAAPPTTSDVPAPPTGTGASEPPAATQDTTAP